MIVVQAVVVLNLGDAAFNISGQTAGTILPNDPIEVLGTMRAERSLLPRRADDPHRRRAVGGLPLHDVRPRDAGRRREREGRGRVRLLVDSARRDQLGGRDRVSRASPGSSSHRSPASNPTSFTLFIVPALGAALLGRMTSFSVDARRRARDRHAPVADDEAGWSSTGYRRAGCRRACRSS